MRGASSLRYALIGLSTVAAFAVPWEVLRAQVSVKGVVTDSTGRPIADAEVRLFVVEVFTQAVATRDDGTFPIHGEMNGHSELRVRRLGFEPKDVVLAFPRDSSRVLEIVL